MKRQAQQLDPTWRSFQSQEFDSAICGKIVGQEEGVRALVAANCNAQEIKIYSTVHAFGLGATPDAWTCDPRGRRVASLSA